MMACFHLIWRELCLYRRNPQVFCFPFLFFISTVLLFPFAMTPDPHWLHQMAPGIIWISLLLSVLMGLAQLFESDRRDGTLEQWLLTGYSLTPYVIGKLTAFWIVQILPLLLMSPLLGLSLGLSSAEMIILFLSLLLGTPSFLLLAGLASVFTLGNTQSSVVMTFILFPLTVPILIFGVGSVLGMSLGGTAAFCLLLLAAFFSICVVLLPITIAWVLRYMI